ncbi:serine acetyltransferase [Microbacterium sp. 22303]|uniref:serine acetyltransferase n=1 Tax=Microbacterium sp. 22303 TaxID=3453905 RepID=UPI003F8497BF
MIRNHDDYLRYIDEDRRALGLSGGFRDLLIHDIWAYQRSMRRVEYCMNTGRSRMAILWARFIFRRRARRLGFSISPNTFGPGLAIAHYGTIAVNGGARIGANCRIHPSTSIGTARGFSDAAPTIGDNAYIGPGARIFGPIRLGDDVSVGANAVVTKSWPEAGLTLVGVPAKPLVRKSSAS